jgi:hypothetical protein
MHKEIPRMAEYWTNNCVGCFVKGDTFDHPKRTCSVQTSELADHYRRGRLNNKVGRGLCFHCLMPMPICDKWKSGEGGDKTNNKPDPAVPCQYQHVNVDTWAILWDQCTRARAVWIARIAASGETSFNENDNGHLQRYFSSPVDIGLRSHVGRICFDVNWITKEYFLDREDPGAELLAESLPANTHASQHGSGSSERFV